MSISAWLSQNKDAIGPLTAIIGVAVAVVGVIVAAIYAWLTYRLANTARDQTRLTRDVAAETRRQAAISQQVFEASHRPYVEVDMQRGDFVDAEHFGFHFIMKNHGAVPAINLRWEVICRKDGQVLVTRASKGAYVLFPGRNAIFDPPAREDTICSLRRQGSALKRELITAVPPIATTSRDFWSNTVAAAG